MHIRIPISLKWFLLCLPIFGFSRSTIAAEIYAYQVNFLFIPSVDVAMKVTPKVQYEDQVVTSLEYYTTTKRFFDSFFRVDNYYKTLYNPRTFEVLYSEKRVSQPNVQQRLIANYRADSVYYSNGEIRSIRPGTHNFFSLLMHMRRIDPGEISQTSIPIDIEGVQYSARFKILGQEILPLKSKGIAARKIEIILEESQDSQKAVTALTDVFNWKIGAGEGERCVWVETEAPHRILKTKFHASPQWLVAKMVAGED